MTKLKPFLLPAFAVATLFPRLLDLPAPLPQVQLTEGLFLILFLVYLRALPGCLWRYRLVFSLAGIYVLANLASAVWAGDAGAGLEAGARGYLVVLSAVTILYVEEYGIERLEYWWRRGTLWVAGFALLLYGLILFGWPDPLHWVAYFDDYPYVGRVARLRGTANTYGMWVMLLLPGLLFSWKAFLQSRGTVVAVAVIGVAMLPTLSKEILLAAAGMILLMPGSHRLRYGTVAILTVVLWAGTHYVLLPPDASRADTAYQVGPVSELPGGSGVKETVYVPVHRTAWRVGLAHPWLGVGPGQFMSYSLEASRPEPLPKDFGPFDPHSTWLGAFAETGTLGVLSLMALVLVLLYHHPAQSGVVGVLLLLFLLASVFKDVANFRGLWVMIGVASMYRVPTLKAPGKCTFT